MVSSRDVLLSFMDALLIGNSDCVHNGASRHLCAAAMQADIFLCNELDSVSRDCYLFRTTSSMLGVSLIS